MHAPDDLFVFAIPLVPRQRATDWQRILSNLRATLRSILNQTDPNFRAVIASNDDFELPELKDPRIQILPVPQNDPAEFEPDNQFQPLRDKLHKQALLAAHAIKLGAGYLMHTDADDLVSNKLVEFVRANPHPVGYALRRGYAMDQTSARILPCPSWAMQVDGFDTYCGTSIILALASASKSHENWPKRAAGINHHLVRSFMIEAGHPLLDIDAPMAVYVLGTGENISGLAGNILEHIDFFHDVIARVRQHGVPMSAAQREEFGLSAGT